MRNAAERTDSEERNAENITRSEGRKMMREGEKIWSRLDMARNKKQRIKVLDGLRKYESEAGISTQKLQRKLEKYGENPEVVAKTLSKVERSSIDEYKRRLDDSKAFFLNPGKFEGPLSEHLKNERDELVRGFKFLPFTEGKPNKLQVMLEINDKEKGILPAKIKFMKRYKKQTPLVKKLFNQMLPELGYTGYKETCLDTVIKAVGGLEDSPQAMQKAFMERSKSITDPKKLLVLKAKLIEEYGAMDHQYLKTLFKNMDVFGGETVSTPDGKMSTTAHEFIVWFREQPSLAAMAEALKALPSYVSERQKLHKRANEILKRATSKDRKKFTTMIKRMRRHELKAFLKDTLEPAVQNDGLMAAEFEGRLITAREGHLNLYSEQEKRSKRESFKRANLEEQKALLTAERVETRERRRVVKTYSLLPPEVREVENFYEANAIERDELLGNAQRKLDANNQYNPFEDFEEGDIASDTQTKNMVDYLEKDAGKHLLDKAIDAAQDTQEAKEVYAQASFWKRIAGIMTAAETAEGGTEEVFGDDLRYWLGGSKTANTERMKTKEHVVETGIDLRRKGIITYSGGELAERQDVSIGDLERGNIAQVEDRLDSARYATDLALVGDDGKEIVHGGARQMRRIVSNTMERFVPQIMESILEQMGIQKEQARAFANSKAGAQLTKNQLLAREFGMESEDDFIH